MVSSLLDNINIHHMYRGIQLFCVPLRRKFGYIAVTCLDSEKHRTDLFRMQKQKRKKACREQESLLSLTCAALLAPQTPPFVPRLGRRKDEKSKQSDFKYNVRPEKRPHVKTVKRSTSHESKQCIRKQKQKQNLQSRRWTKKKKRSGLKANFASIWIRWPCHVQYSRSIMWPVRMVSKACKLSLRTS